MDFFIFIIIFSSSVLTSAKPSAAANNCTSLENQWQCSHFSKSIRFPFRALDLQPQHCGLPGFEISCKRDNPVMHFPSYGDLVVKSIDYDIKKLSLLDPKNCVHEVFLNLNLSLTPFRYYYDLKEYSYINCSSPLSSTPFLQVPCLSGPSYHVYVLEPFEAAAVPLSCKHVKTISIPFSYSPYLADSSFGLGLTWNVTHSKDDEGSASQLLEHETGQKEECLSFAYDKVLGIAVFVVVVLVALIPAICHLKKFNGEKQTNHGEFDMERFLGDYDILKNAVTADC